MAASGIRVESPEDRRQLQLLETPLGENGSGVVRYGAAMYFYRQGQISSELLEAYRICSKLDNDDPLEVARLRSLDHVER